MKLIAVLLIAAALVGACVTTSDLRTGQPVFSGQTDRPAAQYAGCVEEGWQDAGVPNVTYVPKQSGVSLTVAGIAGLDLVMDVRENGQASTVNLYSRLPYGYAKLADIARTCQ